MPTKLLAVFSVGVLLVLACGGPAGPEESVNTAGAADIAAASPGPTPAAVAEEEEIIPPEGSPEGTPEGMIWDWPAGLDTQWVEVVKKDDRWVHYVPCNRDSYRLEADGRTFREGDGFGVTEYTIDAVRQEADGFVVVTSGPGPTYKLTWQGPKHRLAKYGEVVYAPPSAGFPSVDQPPEECGGE